MARRQKLKVFRTPIGFHDAYVAAPSRKAALEAWGSAADLFARGLAEVVTDEALAREPLANPGTVIRRSRGSADEQIAALSPHRPRSKKRSAGSRADPSVSKPRSGPACSREPDNSQRKTAARPSREALDRAEARLADVEQRLTREDEDLRKRERQLERERRELNRAHERDRKAAERNVARAREAHAEALDRWIDDQR